MEYDHNTKKYSWIGSIGDLSSVNNKFERPVRCTRTHFDNDETWFVESERHNLATGCYVAGNYFCFKLDWQNWLVWQKVVTAGFITVNSGLVFDGFLLPKLQITKDINDVLFIHNGYILCSFVFINYL